MRIFKLALGIASTIVIGLVVYYIRKNRWEKRLIVVSDAGYETAFDIIYPLKNTSFRRR